MYNTVAYWYFVLDSSVVSHSEGTVSPSPSLSSEKSYSSQTRDHPSHALLYADEIAVGRWYNLWQITDSSIKLVLIWMY